jgi:N-carbamoyl-L-amino-acid hydrolase
LNPAVDARRVIAELRELDRRTGGPGGARRLCWGEEWRVARAYLGELLAEIGIEGRADAAGNHWAFLDEDAEGCLVLGSHLDSVPEGGWLDGALGVLAALGVLRAWSESGRTPPRGLGLVDWADEEGARFGASLFGSSAFSGTLRVDEVRRLTDREGRSLPDVLAENGVELDNALDAASMRPRLGAYLELHIEQGPVMESEGVAAAAVAGCVGIERHRFDFSGQASHAGTTPMLDRRDAGLAAAETALAVERLAVEADGVGTTGVLALRPGVVTAVAGEARLMVDLRHRHAGTLASMLEGSEAAAREAAEARGCEFESTPVWRIEPIAFDAELVARTASACREAGGRDRPLVSGALHDAAEAARVAPAAMVFCPSIRGISHAKEEDTDERDLAVAIEAYGEAANLILDG